MAGRLSLEQSVVVRIHCPQQKIYRPDFSGRYIFNFNSQNKIKNELLHCILFDDLLIPLRAGFEGAFLSLIIYMN